MVPDTGEFGILIPVILGNVDFAPDDGFDAVTLACRIEISRAVQVAVIGNRGGGIPKSLARRINRSDDRAVEKTVLRVTMQMHKFGHGTIPWKKE